jgi:hypothetical protein
MVNGNLYRVELVPVGKNALKNKTPSAKMSRKKYDYKHYIVLGSMVKKETAQLFRKICKEREITVSTALRRIIEFTISTGFIPE